MSPHPPITKISFLNIRSIRNKIEELELVTNKLSPDILCLSEHWLTPSEINSFCIANYSNTDIFYRKLLSHGGVAILSKPHLNVSHIPEISDFCLEKSFECAGGYWLLHDRQIIVLSLYRSPTGDIQTFLSRLEDVLILSTKIHPIAEIVIGGDLNIDLLTPSTSRTKLLDLVHSFNIYETIASPTRVTSTSSSLIDNIFTSVDASHFTVSSFDPGLSDHHLLTLSLAFPPINEKLKVMKRVFNRKNTDYFLSLLSREEWPSLGSPVDADELFSSFLSAFLHHFNLAFPLKSHSTSRAQTSPWITSELRLEAKELRTLHRNLKLSAKNQNLKQQYLNLKKSHAKNIRQAKLNHNDRKISSSNNIPRATWSLVKSLTAAPVPKANIPILINGMPISDPTSLGNLFNDFFLHSCSTGQTGSTHHNPPGTPGPTDLKTQCEQTIFLYPTTHFEVTQIARKLGSKHSSGLDEIPGSLLTKCMHLISIPLAFLINKSLSSGIFPSKLKLAKVIPIYKHKGKKSDMNNYRPISLLSSFSKIYELIMHDRLLSFFNYHNLLSPSQHGFLKNKSTTTALFSFLSPLYSALDKGEHAVGMFYDLSKAFDTIDHSILLDKLSTLGIRGTAHKWWASYLTGRTQVVEIQFTKKLSTHKYLSKPKTLVAGVPQGSILGPLAFTVFTNDLLNFLDEDTLTQYADDWSQLLTCPKNSIAAMPPLVNNQASQLSVYCHSNLLTISLAKTTYLSFHSPLNIPKSSPLIWLDGKSITRTNSTKLLGLYMSETLDWSIHINHVASKIQSGCFILRKLKQLVHPHILKMVYFAHVHSFISYGLLFWGASPHAIRIFTLQKRAIRIMAGVSRRHTCRELFKELGIPTLACSLIQAAAIFVRSYPNLFPLNTSVHSHFTRANLQIHIPNHKLTLFSKGPQYLALTLYNKLPNNTRTCPSISTFKSSIKSFLNSKSFYSLNEYLSA